MSNTTVIYPMVTALVKAEEVIGPDRDWKAVNSQQKSFLTNFFKPCREESADIQEIESIASFSADEINQFLSERDFKISLKPFMNSKQVKEFGIASVLDLLVSWLKPGTEMTIQGQRDGKSYPGVSLSRQGCAFFRAAQHEHPIAQLKTQTSDEVYITKLSEGLADFKLFQYARQLAGTLRAINDYDSVQFPMVDLKQEEDVSWLSELYTEMDDHRTARVNQALQETHLAVNPQGAHAQSAFAGSITMTASYRRPVPPLVIDEPFLIWFQRPSLSQPLFVGYITEENWKNPGSL